jgi:hypothetical protein
MATCLGLGCALLGSSRQLAIGPTSAISLMIAGTIGEMAGGDAAHYAEIASLAGFTVALLYLMRHFSETEESFYLNIDFTGHVALIALVEENGRLTMSAAAAMWSIDRVRPKSLSPWSINIRGRESERLC